MIQLLVGAREIERLARKVRGSAARLPVEQGRFAKAVGKGVKDLAVKRIRVTKRDPDGKPWMPWAASYARTRNANHSLLINKRKLVNRFNVYASPAGRLIRVWNSAPYSAFVQHKRPFLGVGRQEDELVQSLARRFFNQVLS